MNIAIIVLLVIAIFFHGYFRISWNDYEFSTNCNWFALTALILYLIKTFY